MGKAAKRQHYIARFYLRNFAEPIFSDNLRFYDLQKEQWEKRSTRGVGWFPHLFSMIDAEGKRTDEFDQFIKREVEDPAAPALKKLALQEDLDADERSAVALFVALTAARSPGWMKSIMAQHVDRLSDADQAELDHLVRLWCQWTGKAYDSNSQNEFLKPSSFGAIWIWSQSLQKRLVRWEWRLVTTARDKPFVTSDRPVFAQWDREQDIRLVGFPVSSEVALIILTGGQLSESRDRGNDLSAMNRQTIYHATEFVASWKEVDIAELKPQSRQ